MNKLSVLSRFSFSAFCLIVLLSLGACDVIEAPYLEKDANAFAASSEECIGFANAQGDPFAGVPIVKKVLIEEITGHQCGNCPEATETIHHIANNVFPGKVISIGIHSGPLARFKEGASKYFTNFTTPEGDEIYGELNSANAVPFGMIDRKIMNTAFGTWQSAIESQLQEPADVGISIYNCYNPDSLLLSAVINLKYFKDVSDEDRLTVYLIEDNIVDWQKDYNASNPDIENYTHHNIFRDALNGTWGELVSDASIKSGDTFQQAYSLRINEGYDVNNCKVVAFVYDKDTRIVRQVEEASIIQ